MRHSRWVRMSFKQLEGLSTYLEKISEDRRNFHLCLKSWNFDGVGMQQKT